VSGRNRLERQRTTFRMALRVPGDMLSALLRIVGKWQPRYLEVWVNDASFTGKPCPFSNRLPLTLDSAWVAHQHSYVQHQGAFYN
jgi:hypothetical protein